MKSRLPAPLTGTLIGLPLLLLAHCSVDQRGLEFGYGVSHGSSTSAPAGGAGNSDASGGGGEGQAEGGVNAGTAQAGTNGASGDATAEGGVPSSAGTNGASAGGAGGPVLTGDGGAGGSAGNGAQPEVGPCGDVDQNQVQDCDETLTHNARFDSTVQDWVADAGLTQAWQATDALGNSSSGSILLTFATSGVSSGWSLAATGQCVPALSQKSYEVGARAHMPEGQGEARATITLVIFGNADCAGPFLASETPTVMGQAGSWQTMHGSFKTPPGTRSVLVRLGATKPGSQPAMNVSFDDVLFRQK